MSKKLVCLLVVLVVAIVLAAGARQPIRAQFARTYTNIRGVLAAGVGKHSGEQQRTTATAAINSHGGRISLQSLNTNRPPKESELRRTGQLGSPLPPSSPADPARISDPTSRHAQERDNLLFGEAMQQWNSHHYAEAVKLFQEHRKQFADS